jgi:hypothetical protein
VDAVRHTSKSRNITQFSIAAVMEKGIYFNLFLYPHLNMIYLLSTMWLTAGGSSTVQIYTHKIYRSTNGTEYTDHTWQ